MIKDEVFTASKARRRGKFARTRCGATSSHLVRGKYQKPMEVCGPYGKCL